MTFESNIAFDSDIVHNPTFACGLSLRDPRFSCGLSGSIPRMSTGLLGVFSADYLEVSPTVMWLTEENLFSGEFEVVSNVSWIIEGGTDIEAIGVLANSTKIDNSTWIKN